MILGYGRRSRRATFAIAIIILLPLLFAPTTCAVREVREGRKAFRSFDERIRAYDSIMTASPDTAATARFSEIEYLGSFDAAGIRKSALIERGKQSEANLLEPHSKFARVAIAARDRARPVVMHGPENHAITVLKPTFGGAPARFDGWIVMTLLPNDLAETIAASKPMTQIDIVDAATSAVIGQNAKAGVNGGGSAGLRLRHTTNFFGQNWVVFQTRRQSLSAFMASRATILSFAVFLMAVLIWRLLSARRRAFEVGDKMLDTLGDAIIVLNPDGQIVYASDSMVNVLGYLPEQLLTKRLIDLAEKESVETLNAALDRSHTSDTKEMLPRMAFRGETGTTRYADVSSRRIVARSATVGILITMHDVTDMLALERQVEQTARLDSLGRVAAKVAHDFNNILMGIDLHAKLLMKKSTDETIQTSLAHVAKSVERGKEIASAILRFSRPAEVRRHPLDVKKLLYELEAEIRPLLDPKIHLDVIVPDEDVTVPADAAQIAQVITNVTLNARDAMPAGGPILWMAEKSAGGRFEFGVVPPGEFLHLQISDRGEGIPRQMVDRIFEPLFTTKQHGTGLGLAISHQIVTKHEGLMFAESNVGAGTSIHVFLPMRAHAIQPTSQ